MTRHHHETANIAPPVITSAAYANGKVTVVWQTYNTQNLTGFLVTFYDAGGHTSQNTPATPGTVTTVNFTPSPPLTAGWTYNVILYPMIGGAPFPGAATQPYRVTGTP